MGNSKHKTIALIKAGGVGNRMGAGIPKQFIEVYDKPIIIYTLEAFERHPNIDAIVVVCVDGWHDVLRSYSEKYNISKLCKIVSGGTTSLKSIQNGVIAIKELFSDDDVVLIHDGNRPLVSQEIISSVLSEREIHGVAVAAVPCTDEVMEADDTTKSASRCLDHKKLFRIQTPDAYIIKDIVNMFDDATEDQLNSIGATNVLAMELNRNVQLAEGSETNIRLTTQDDIVLFESLFKIKNEV